MVTGVLINYVDLKKKNLFGVDCVVKSRNGEGSATAGDEPDPRTDQSPASRAKASDSTITADAEAMNNTKSSWSAVLHKTMLKDFNFAAGPAFPFVKTNFQVLVIEIQLYPICFYEIWR